MNNFYPIYTTANECQDCYKCVRHCSCKAIQIVNARAAVMPDRCVCCGECVKVCPSHAKKIRSDLGRAKLLVETKETVYASIAPSFHGYFPNVPIERLAAALKQLGFAGASETALGAQLVSSFNAQALAESKPGVYLSSACPAIVDYVGKYLPEWKDAILPIASPVMAHAKLLRQTFQVEGEKPIKIVFFGPCAAKKNESDRCGSVLNLALTFAELQNWLDEAKIDLSDAASLPDAPLVPEPAQEGRLYSFEGGMNDTMRSDDTSVQFLAISGLPNVQRVLQQVDRATVETLGGKVFLELLACDGGCVNGPVMPEGGSKIDVLMKTALAAQQAAKQAAAQTARAAKQQQPTVQRVSADVGHKLMSSVGRPVNLDIRQPILVQPIHDLPKEEWVIKEALESVGKFKPEDELNCGGCGYNTCRQFAQAMIDGKAESKMCLSWLRKNSEKTSNALIKFIPTAVVLADKNLQVIECNRHFAQLAGDDTLEAFDAVGNLTGAFLDTIVEYTDLFNMVLKSGEEVERYNQLYGNRIVNISVFSISPGQTVGAVIQDVTQSELQREQIAEKAREVIRKNVLTVQKIARDLGEHMADTEILLNEVAGTYCDHSPIAGLEVRLPGDEKKSDEKTDVEKKSDENGEGKP